MLSSRAPIAPAPNVSKTKTLRRLALPLALALHFWLAPVLSLHKSLPCLGDGPISAAQHWGLGTSAFLLPSQSERGVGGGSHRRVSLKGLHLKSPSAPRRNQRVADLGLNATEAAGAEGASASLCSSSLLRQLREDFADSTEGGSGAVLKVERLCVHSDAVVILSDVSFQLQRGEKLALVGSNGAGKTTLLQTLAAVAQRMGCSDPLSSQGSSAHEASSARGCTRGDGARKRLSKASRRELKKSKLSRKEDPPPAAALKSAESHSPLSNSGTWFGGRETEASDETPGVEVAQTDHLRLEMFPVHRGAFIRSGSVYLSPAFSRVGFLRQEGLEGLSVEDSQTSVLDHVKTHIALRQRELLTRVAQLEEELQTLSRLKSKSANPADEAALDLRLRRTAERLSLSLREVQRGEADARWAEVVLHYVGLAGTLRERPVGTLSGGQRMRVLLAKVLSERPSLLFLDEPTNHCDVASSAEIALLLQRLPLPCIIASHDRQLLQRVSSGTLFLRGGQAAAKHVGSFRSFLEKRMQHQRQWEGEVEDKKRAQGSLQRKKEEHGGQLSRADSERLDSLQKELAQMRVSPPPLCEPPSRGPVFSLSFFRGATNFHSQNALVLRDCSLAFASPSGLHSLLVDVSLSVEVGEKVALVGPNGAGKSSLLRALAGRVSKLGEEELLSGKRAEGAGSEEARLVFVRGEREASRAVDASCLLLEQHHADIVPLEKTALEALREMAKTTFPKAFFAAQNAEESLADNRLLEALGKVGLGGPLSRRSVSAMSGGEKARVNLARALLLTAGCARGEMACGLLALDEPTNHLDAVAIRALTGSLRSYGGSLVIATHDAAFAAAIADSVFFVDPTEKTLKPWRPGRFAPVEKEQRTQEAVNGSATLSPHAETEGELGSRRWAELFASAWELTPRGSRPSCAEHRERFRSSQSSLLEEKRRRNFGGSGMSSGRIKGVKNLKRWQ